MKKLRFGSIIVTYRCNAKCYMCHTWKFPSDPKRELKPNEYEKLPYMDTVNITGGEPFLREDIEELINIIRSKTNRLVISTNGFLTDRIIKLFEKRKDIGIRVSLEGLPASNDMLRGIKNGFDKGIRTLINLYKMGVKDIGFAITVSDKNAKDLNELYFLSKMMKIEFATATIHNSFYFHKYDNKFENPEYVIAQFRTLIEEMLRSRKIKEWYRAYFNFGLINYIKGNPRLLPCEMGFDSFFLDPYGEIFPCNVMQESMGNIREKSFCEIWNSKRAKEVRSKVKNCSKNCWMIGSVSQQIKKYIHKPTIWIIKHKFMKNEICV